MYDVIYKKLTNTSSHLIYVTNRFQDLRATSIKLNMLDEVMKQYEPNNFVSEPRHYISVSVLVIIIFLAWYFRIDKYCKKKRQNIKFLPLAITKAKNRTDDTELTIGQLQEILLEDRIKMNRRK